MILDVLQSVALQNTGFSHRRAQCFMQLGFEPGKRQANSRIDPAHLLQCPLYRDGVCFQKEVIMQAK
jgi:hypothetical protein